MQGCRGGSGRSRDRGRECGGARKFGGRDRDLPHGAGGAGAACWRLRWHGPCGPLRAAALAARVPGWRGAQPHPPWFQLPPRRLGGGWRAADGNGHLSGFLRRWHGATSMDRELGDLPAPSSFRLHRHRHGSELGRELCGGRHFHGPRRGPLDGQRLPIVTPRWCLLALRPGLRRGLCGALLRHAGDEGPDLGGDLRPLRGQGQHTWSEAARLSLTGTNSAIGRGYAQLCAGAPGNQALSAELCFQRC
mmetsp:Transcript_80622/g.261236  ORF Transcript_80622/g.261236 Transcript_80622/m.261236 type:complete len:248 (+) Transcript_80622:1295-2038(+)